MSFSSAGNIPSNMDAIVHNSPREMARNIRIGYLGFSFERRQSFSSRLGLVIECVGGGSAEVVDCLHY